MGSFISKDGQSVLLFINPITIVGHGSWFAFSLIFFLVLSVTKCELPLSHLGGQTQTSADDLIMN